jgi:hypothetical protein
VKVYKECIDEFLSFTSEKLRIDTVDLIPVEVKI